MSNTFARLTLYAILSAMEEDLRHLLDGCLSEQASPRSLLGDELYQRAVERFGRDNAVRESEPSFDQLLIFTDFGDLIQLLARHRALLPQEVALALKELLPYLDRLAPIRNRVMHSRPLDFEDLPFVSDFADRVLADSRIGSQALQAAVREINENPSSVLRYALPTAKDETSVFNNLPLPEFDETGFIGRKRTLEQVLRACVGPYPVITIVGEGGIGKTALALKVAYELLDREDCPFEAIVWTTSKTSQLGTSEILRVEGAIEDSLGVMRSVATALGDANHLDPLAAVLEHMREFRILLVLDNLETVLDERIRVFLGNLPIGSKILLTSRVGVGAFEYPVKLEPLEDEEAVQLLRAVAKARGVGGLTKTTNKNLQGFCSRMRNNPLHIKWFVSAVQAGRRPEEVLADERLFLKFCMENVFVYLAEESRVVLDALMILGGAYSLAELSFITEYGDVQLKRAVQQLVSMNMLVAESRPLGTTYETSFEVAPLSRAYVRTIRKVPEEQAKRFTKRKQQLVAIGEQVHAGHLINPVSAFNLEVRSRGDWVVARLLVEAFKAAKRRDYATAMELVQRGRELTPDYFEVFRVEAWLHAEQGNVSDANAAYEAALDLAPQSKAVRTLYGGFLMRYMDDTAGAVEQLQSAVALGAGVEAQLELARAYLFTLDFDRADAAISEIERGPDAGERAKRIAIDLRMQHFLRTADHESLGGSPGKALAMLEGLMSFYSGIQAPDLLLRQKLRKAFQTARRVAGQLEDVELSHRADLVTQWIESLTGPIGGLSAIRGLGEGEGVVRALPLRHNFGFLEIAGGRELYFHRSVMVIPGEWSRLTLGALVEFELGEVDNRPCALQVRMSTKPSHGTVLSRVGQTVQGIVARLLVPNRFGFLRAEDGPEFFFHKSAVVPPDDWDKLIPGVRVEFLVGVAPDGRQRADRVTVLP